MALYKFRIIIIIIITCMACPVATTVSEGETAYVL